MSDLEKSYKEAINEPSYEEIKSENESLRHQVTDFERALELRLKSCIPIHDANTQLTLEKERLKEQIEVYRKQVEELTRQRDLVRTTVDLIKKTIFTDCYECDAAINGLHAECQSCGSSKVRLCCKWIAQAETVVSQLNTETKETEKP